MFSTIMVLINLLDYPPAVPACGQYSKSYRSIGLQPSSKWFRCLGFEVSLHAAVRRNLSDCHQLPRNERGSLYFDGQVGNRSYARYVSSDQLITQIQKS